MRPDFDRNISIANDVQIGMVCFVFGNLGNRFKEPHTGHEIRDRPIFANPLAFVCELPTVKLFELTLRLRKGARLDTAFAGLALFSDQLTAWQDIHLLIASITSFAFSSSQSVANVGSLRSCSTSRKRRSVRKRSVSRLPVSDRRRDPEIEDRPTRERCVRRN